MTSLWRGGGMGKFFAAPFRLCLGLPAFYGMTLTNRIQQIGRAIGFYKGPIHYRVMAEPIHFGMTGKDV